MKLWKYKMAAIILAVTLAGCGVQTADTPQRAERSLFAMNTYMTFTAYGEGAETALQKSEDLIREEESLWSVTEEGSDIYRANHSGGADSRCQRRDRRPDFFCTGNGAEDRWRIGSHHLSSAHSLGIYYRS
ncbi:hypothetical protein WGC32_05395 [Zongyangia sp. HA2173]|uniref:hypothetical protein n=1 Tax=Zongyangia sp. HA2173 TaxID=3133035 RepID=UPI00316615CC